MGCGQPCVGFYCYLCTCQQCGFSLNNGTCMNCTYGDGKPVTCCECESPLNGGFCLICASRAGNSSACDPNPNSYNDSLNFSDYTPQPQYQTYYCELCGNNAHYGYDCPPQSPFHAKPEDIQELLHKLLKDLQIISEELSKFINYPSWNRATFYNDDNDNTIQYKEYLENSSKAIAPDLPTEEPDNSLSMGDEHLDTIPKTESDEVRKSSVKNLVLIPSESEGISDDTCDVLVCEDSSTFDALKDHSLILSDSNNDGISSDDDDFEDIEYVEASPPDSELVSLEESPSSFHIPVADSDSFFEEFDTSLSYSVNSLPEFETFSNHKEETSSGSTTTYANNSLPEYDSFHFKIEPDQGELTNVVMETILGEPRVHMLNILPTQPTLDSNFTPSDDSLGSDLEVSFPTGSRNKIFDSGIFIEVQSERLLSRDAFGILSSPFLSHRDKSIFDFSKIPMMISGGDIPHLDVPFHHFYPP
ncbi:hypothetical protein Tco_0846160 [Tanacetum coccineum]